MPAARWLSKGFAVTTAVLAATLAAGSVGGAGLVTAGQSGWFDFSLSTSGFPIGHHRITYKHDGDDLLLSYDTDVSFSIAFISIAKYKQTVEQRWRNGRLQSLDARTQDGDTVHEVHARATPQGLAIDGPSGSFVAPANTMPTYYWEPSMIGAARVLDIEKGKLIDVTFTREGQETISFEGRNVQADVIKVSGDKQAEFAWTRENEIVLRELMSHGRRIAFVRDASGMVPVTAAAQAPAARK